MQSGNKPKRHSYGDEWTRKRILEEVWSISGFVNDYIPEHNLGYTLAHLVRKHVKNIEQLLEKDTEEA